MDIEQPSINAINNLYQISGVEVGQHFHLQIGNFQVHAQGFLITSWVVIAILLGLSIVATRDLQTIPTVKISLNMFLNLFET